MTLQRAQQILKKLMESMNYNNRKNQEYASGLSNAYARAHRLIQESPWEEDTKPLTNEELDEIIIILENRIKNAKSYISAYLVQVFIIEKDLLDVDDTQHLLFFLGCVVGLHASICILEQIEL